MINIIKLLEIIIKGKFVEDLACISNYITLIENSSRGNYIKPRAFNSKYLFMVFTVRF